MKALEKFKSTDKQSKSLNKALHGYFTVSHRISNDCLNTLMFDTYKEASKYYSSIKLIA